MPGSRSNSPLGRAVGVTVAGLAVVLLALRWTDLPVPYGYDSDNIGVALLGAAVAVIAVALSGYRYRSEE